MSLDMAIRPAKAFGSTVETWLKLQMNYDLAQARKNERSIRVSRYKREDRAV